MMILFSSLTTIFLVSIIYLSPIITESNHVRLQLRRPRTWNSRSLRKEPCISQSKLLPTILDRTWKALLTVAVSSEASSRCRLIIYTVIFLRPITYARVIWFSSKNEFSTFTTIYSRHLLNMQYSTSKEKNVYHSRWASNGMMNQGKIQKNWF